MNLAFRIILLTALLFSPCRGQSSESNTKAKDKWFAQDKLEHYSISVFGTAVSAKVANRHFEMTKDHSIRLGVGVTISLGTIKEVIDHKSGRGTASIKDFIWDFAGCLTGAMLADLLL